MVAMLHEKPNINPATVRSLRFRNRMTQQDLAAAAGLSIGQVNRIEGGKIASPHYSTVDKLAEALKVDPDDLMES